MFEIGNIKIKNRVVLAPMAGVSNSAYRTIIKEMGAGLIYAEMVSDKAITYGNKKTIDMLYMTDAERPIAQQIFGSDKDSFVEAAKYIYQNMHPDIIDINMGCPVPKVALRAQAGSALLKDPDKIYDIVSSVVEAVPIPVTVKIRSGWDSNHINTLEVAKKIEEAGAKAIAIHARTRSQGYSGKADWNIIKLVKENVGIPVIGNGDIKNCYDAKKMLTETGCDAVMIGRAALGNPWIIRDCVNYLENGQLPSEVTLEEKLDMILKHIEYLKKIKNDKVANLEMRTHIGYYLKGVKSANILKQKVFKCNSLFELEKLIKEFKEVECEIKDNS